MNLFKRKKSPETKLSEAQQAQADYESSKILPVDPSKVVIDAPQAQEIMDELSERKAGNEAGQVANQQEQAKQLGEVALPSEVSKPENAQLVS